MKVIYKVQQEYRSDIFGFGEIIHEQLPKTWKEMDDTWENEFSKLKFTVQSKVMIDNSARTSRSIRIGD